jgi:FMN-dependent NADH-azoreductase
MSNVLIVTSSALGASSVSTRIADEYEARLRATYPGVEIVRRDVGADPVPHLTTDTVGAIRGANDTDAQRRTVDLSDRLIAELQAAELIVIASPMYNFGISSTLKAWFDHVLRAGVTFRYTESGPEGLLKGKQAVVIESRGGLYSEGPGAALNSQEPHLRTMLGFMGVDEVRFVLAEKLAFGPEAAEQSIAGAVAELHGLAAAELALAA